MAVFRNTSWRWISGILGVTCLLLMTTLGILLKNLDPKPHIEPTISPGSTLDFQKDSEYSLCQERWIGYQCNCYFISRDFKTWNESSNFCASQNSTLLQIHNKHELRFMKLNRQFYWIGVTYSPKHLAWMWLDGSPVSRDLLQISKTADTVKCITYRPSLGALDEACETKNLYICKKIT